jgi:hypothetical protein
MFKVIFLLLVTVNFLIANSFNFSELRYNDATGKYKQLDGKITFLEDGLKIFYPKGSKLLEYENDNLIYKEKNKEIELNDMQSQQIMYYFDVLILLHTGDEKAYDGIFSVSKNNGMTILKPLGSIKNYINNIEIIKEDEELKQVKLFLKNNDSITITIDDKI